MSTPPPSPNAPLYFRGLNALRVYAALSVVIVHISTNFGELRTSSAIFPPLDVLVMDAQSAVSLFFVLSGFLITVLLLTERTRTETISIRNFYVRRVLRILPLYYLIAIIGFFALPLIVGADYALYDPPTRTVILVFVMLPNLVGPLGPLGHLWTIGLEEQFYAVMPWLVKGRRLVFAISIIVTLKLVLEPVIAAFNSDAMMNLFHGSRFECMAIGAFGAWLYHNAHPALRYVYHPAAQIAAAAVCVVVAVVDIPVSSVNTFGLSIAFTVLILNAATNPRSPLCVETRLTNHFGVRSYGIYMFHFPVLYLVLFGLRTAGVPDGGGYNLLLYALTLGATLILAEVSYRLFEQPILRLKSRFEIVRSRASAGVGASTS